MKEVAIGIDIGGTFSKFGIIDKDGESLGDNSIETTGYEKVESFIKALSDAILKLKDSIGKDLTVVGVGIGAPNGNYYSGTIEYAPNLPWKGVIPMVELFSKFYTVPVTLTNDANAAAIGEMVYGGAKNMKDFVVITLGTGLGSGIVSNGELVYGHDGFAGEVGHVQAIPDGRICGCEKRGCLETYASATGIKRTVFELLCDETVPSKLRDVSFNDLTAKMIGKAAQEGDPIARKAFEFTGRILGMKLADTVAHSSPEAIFLFGGLVNAGEMLFKPTKEHFEKNLLKIYRNKIKILPSGLRETNAAVLGASALVWKERAKNPALVNK
ncbi:MAG TPA: ROK family protein [Cyclobacteriaceae bacterium]|nr:ROK family protein [Cyclobacteriaceae bacterium]